MAASPPDVTSLLRGERRDKAGSTFMKKSKAFQKTSEDFCSDFSLHAPCHKARPPAPVPQHPGQPWSPPHRRGFKPSLGGGGNNGLPSPSETSQNPHPQHNHEENTRKIQNGGSFYKMPDTLLKTVKVIQKKENLRNCHHHWEPKDT